MVGEVDAAGRAPLPAGVEPPRSVGHRLARAAAPVAIAAIGGVTFALGTPPTDLYPCLVLGLAGLGASLETAPNAARGFVRGAAWGTAVGLVAIRFVPTVVARFTHLGAVGGLAAHVLLTAAQGIPWGLGAALAVTLRRRAHAPIEVALPTAVLVALLLPTVFPWSPAGLATPWPAFVQLADLVGERGVSAIFAVVGAVVARALVALARPADARVRLRAASVPLGAAAAILAALGLCGAVRMRAVERDRAALPTATIGLVDVAVPPLERWDPRNHAPILRALRAETARAEAQGAELTIWPEAAYPYPIGRDTRHVPPRGHRAPIGEGVRGPLLMGFITETPPVVVAPGVVERTSWNSAAIVAQDGSLSLPYDKIELLWFGETVPGGQTFPWLRRTFQRSGGLVPGTGPRALDLPRDGGPALRMAVLNCYEDTLTSVSRGHARAIGPNLLVNVTNDAWFDGTAEPELHARLAALRAVEHRLDLVRAVNRGVASWVSASGRVIARYDAPTPGVLMATPAVREPASPTPYARFGDVPTALLLALACAESLRRGRRREATTGPSSP